MSDSKYSFLDDSALPAWLLMWLIALLLFVLAKMAMFRRSRSLQGWRLWAWALAWPGMETRNWTIANPSRCQSLPWFAGLPAMVTGALCIWWLARRVPSPLLAGWIGMIGVVLMLHFGSFRWLAGFWQRRGVSVLPLMNRPLAAASVAEFWGGRWNLAFRDLARELIGRPLSRSHGGRLALWAVFAMSGVLHELVISVPAGACYGLPTLYFLWQALVIEWEKAWGLRGRTWVALMTFAPVLSLFPPPFVERVILPFLHFLGALP